MSHSLSDYALVFIINTVVKKYLCKMLTILWFCLKAWTLTKGPWWCGLCRRCTQDSPGIYHYSTWQTKIPRFSEFQQLAQGHPVSGITGLKARCVWLQTHAFAPVWPGSCISSGYTRHFHARCRNPIHVWGLSPQSVYKMGWRNKDGHRFFDIPSMEMWV